jgi:hypothetical protein
MIRRCPNRVRVVATWGALFSAFAVGVGEANAAVGWERVSSMGQARGGHTSTPLLSGEVLAVGGTDGPESPATAELYDPGANSWSPAGSLSAPRLGHTATLLPSGRVLVAGSSGCACMAPAASTEVYDRVANSWTPGPAMSTGRSGHTATLLSNFAAAKILVAGGSGSGGARSSAETYDTGTDTWSPTGGMANARSGHTDTKLPDGRVLVVGGGTATAELYDPAGGTWSSANSMSVARTEHTATVLPDGKVLVAGGYGPSGELASTELYDPSTGNWSSGPSMATPRAQHTATMLGSSGFLPPMTLVVAGGSTPTGPSADVELFDTASGQWSGGRPMTLPRLWHTDAVVDGKVLAIGGYSPGPGIVRGTATVERYPVELPTAPPPPPPGLPGPAVTTPPPGPDTRAPDATLARATTQKLGPTVGVTVACGAAEECIVSAKGSLSVPGAARSYALKAARKRLAAGRRAAMKLKLPSKGRSAASRALRRRKKVKATVLVTVADAAGNKRTLKQTIRLKR